MKKHYPNTYFAVLHILLMLSFTYTVQKNSVRPSIALTHLSYETTSALCNAAGFIKMLLSTHRLFQAPERRKKPEEFCEYLSTPPGYSGSQLNIVKNKKILRGQPEFYTPLVTTGGGK